MLCWVVLYELIRTFFHSTKFLFLSMLVAVGILKYFIFCRFFSLFCMITIFILDMPCGYRYAIWIWHVDTLYFVIILLQSLMSVFLPFPFWRYLQIILWSYLYIALLCCPATISQSKTFLCVFLTGHLMFARCPHY